MLLSLPELMVAHDLKIDGVLHLGAHLAEEAEIYEELGITHVLWVEANHNVLDHIERVLYPYPDQHVIHALVYGEAGVELNFNITNNDGMSSSIYEFGTHPTFSPETVYVEKVTMTTTTVDDIMATTHWKANFLNMDLQGAELEAVKGAEKFLAGCDYVMAEINSEQVYQGCAQVEELDAFLDERGFDRVEHYWVPGQGWGDGFYVRRGL